MRSAEDGRASAEDAGDGRVRAEDRVGQSSEHLRRVRLVVALQLALCHRQHSTDGHRVREVSEHRLPALRFRVQG